MNYLDLYLKYRGLIQVRLDKIYENRRSSKSVFIKTISDTKYWTRDKTHRLYVSLLGGPIPYGYIDLVTGDVYPNKKDINGIPYTQDRIKNNEEALNKKWSLILMTISDIIREEAEQQLRISDYLFDESRKYAEKHES